MDNDITPTAMKILVRNRIELWHDAAKRAGKPFTFTVVDEDTVEVSLCSLPNKNPFDYSNSTASRLPKLISFGLQELEDIGSHYGVFRPAETRSRGILNLFQAYDLAR